MTTFIKKFNHFFYPCEIGFRNEMVMSLFSREFPIGEEVISFGKKPAAMYFIVNGNCDMFNRKGDLFMHLTDGNILGDH
jgi:signal-transduction protein with cAMP-binding, CBS, and nucleotidyltransferase domain